MTLEDFMSTLDLIPTMPTKYASIGQGHDVYADVDNGCYVFNIQSDTNGFFWYEVEQWDELVACQGPYNENADCLFPDMLRDLITKRLADIESGKSKTIPGDLAIAHLRREITKEEMYAQRDARLAAEEAAKPCWECNGTKEVHTVCDQGHYGHSRPCERCK